MELIEILGIEKKDGNKRGERYGLFKCPVCNKTVKKIFKDGLAQQRCSHDCYAKTRMKRGAYKKKIIIKKYIYIYTPEHPHAIGTKKLYVSEHRLIMEKLLGRYLTKDEIVHHKDENTMNNNIDNLILMTASEHNSFHSKKRIRKNGKF